ncbi:glutamate carboxypeptidase [Cupriavidus plantarum]|uniref:Glutamate carboxypeptidase n=1 Tax=Cupriavidus plantarum TaxID=942865 RepID=A0A316EUB7_9BURK|nr:glutamate carboxypeptidase [Cupriavidus plantarum]NYI00921.1 glutamate carboxypeptidase [Cupriavidus plantarum]PWK35332.1 glutamate carboxypeptidase [Cupriavidus plantarum]REE93776.1 glutamate carboxypeptidase [Cupriavidus plantarum]RLK39198.1 glutamate carboxypeptidase [Cupriavidus plantarum]CAG2134819.1 Carboxypeptidase G2 [Cupriavidus plantarum]
MKRLVLCALALAAATAVSSGCSDSNAASPTYDSALDSASKAQQPAVMQMLEQLVNIETGTGDTVGMPQMADYLAQQLAGLGATVSRQQAAAGVVGENIVGRFKGTGSVKILMIAHMDTVYPRGYLAKAPFRVDGNRAYGPGIADDKGGIAVILNSLAILKARGFNEYGEIVVMFNTDEEKGSFGSRDLIQQLSAGADYVISHEPSGETEGIGLATSGIAYVEAKITGKAAHAGVAPELGVNALTEAADLILRTQDIDNKSKEMRFNWTLAKAGSASNAIPDSATLNADVRYGRNEDLEAIQSMLSERAQRKRLPAATVEVSVTPGRPAFNANDGGKFLANKAAAIYQELGYTLTVSDTRTGGGTDAAYAALSGKPVVESMGLPGFGYHTSSAEYVLIDAIPRRLYLSTRMLMDLSRGQ